MVAGEFEVSGWCWDDAAECTRRLDAVREDSARCEKLQELDIDPPFGRLALRDIGVTGIEFAAFQSRHPTGLGADYVSVRSDDATTRQGRIFLLDGESCFTELDITKQLPFESGSMDWVYAEHLIEHVPLDVGVAWLAELRRTLAPGGLLRLTTPDLRKYAESYLSDDGFFADHRQRLLEVLAPAPPMPSRPAFMVNQLFQMYGHRWIYDLDELRYALGRAGFDPAAMRVCGFRSGSRPDVAELDRAIRSDETIYVEIRT